MLQSFIAIDFETANPQRVSACSLGVTKVVDGVITDRHTYLIHPVGEYSRLNIAVHGIRPEQTADAPSFDQLYEAIRLDFETNPILCYSTFDQSVFEALMDYYALPCRGPLEFIDVYQIARNVIQGLPNYKLPTVAYHLNIPYMTHHDAGCDAEQCAKVYLRLSELISEGLSSCRTEVGGIESEFEDLYRSVMADGKVTVETGYEILRLFDSLACRSQIYSDFRRVMADVLADSFVTPGESELVVAMLKYVHNVLTGVEPAPTPPVRSMHKIGVPIPTFDEDYSFEPKMVVEQERINIPDDFIPAMREIPKNYLEHWDEVRAHPFTTLASANVVVTEEGVRISREEAERLVVRLGGNLKSSTSRVTDFCVVLGMPPESCTTTKVTKAREVQNQGSPIRILSEDEFIELVKASIA